MITMGIFAILQKDTKIMNLSLIKSLKYLGLFGITHGISEWISLVIKLELCHPYFHPELYNINIIIKAISFAFLLHFGLDLLPLRDKYKNIVLKIPILIFVLYLSGFFLLMENYGAYYHLTNPKYNTIALRYLMGFPSCIISAIALYNNARIIEKTKSVKISRRYKNLSWVFIFYGLLEGLLVTRASYFPANIINKELFVEYLNFSPLSIKAFVGFAINLLLIKVIDTFSWEQEEKLKQLEELRIASKERRKLGLEIHDSIIQGLYAAGLKIDYLLMNKDVDKKIDILDQIKSDLNNTIQKTRQFISTTSMDKIKLEDLKYNLEQLVKMFNENQSIRINLNCEIYPYIRGHLSPDTSTQIYYIIQEAISNAIKHSEAEYVNVLLEGRCDFLYITVTDNGKGISLEESNPQKQFGVSSMKERTGRIGGAFAIGRVTNGTRIELKIPWDETKSEEY